MPKFEHRHEGGTAIPKKLRSFLRDFFDESEIEKIEILGGNIDITISTAQRGIKKDKKKKIDTAYISTLREIVQSRGDLHYELLTLTRQQLDELCSILSLPVSSQMTNREKIRAISDRLHAHRRWGGIINS